MNNILIPDKKLIAWLNYLGIDDNNYENMVANRIIIDFLQDLGYRIECFKIKNKHNMILDIIKEEE